MNKLWHEQNKMPPKATLDQRIQWHSAHQIYCACREVPKNLIALRPERFEARKGRRKTPSA
jgi:hypothetical protein